jgi:hypothetical protein
MFMVIQQDPLSVCGSIRQLHLYLTGYQGKVAAVRTHRAVAGACEPGPHEMDRGVSIRPWAFHSVFWALAAAAESGDTRAPAEVVQEVLGATQPVIENALRTLA